MPDEPEQLTPEDFDRALGRGRNFLKPALYGLGGVAVLVVLFLVGTSLLRKDESAKTEPKHSDPIPLLFADESDTAGLAELLHDTLRFGEDGLVEPFDSLELPPQSLTTAQIDTNEVLEIPGFDLMKERELLNAQVSANETPLDLNIDIETAITSPIKEIFRPELPQMPWERQDEVAPTPDSARIAITVPPAQPGPGQAVVDSLTAALATRELQINLLTQNNERLTDKLSRVRGAIDSTRSGQIKRLAKILETMSPAAAASMLGDRSPDEVSEILFKVKPRTAAKILEQLPPVLASDIAARVVRQ